MAKINMKKLDHWYSGNNSKRFWKRVNKVKPEGDHNRLYTLGCILQNLEEFVLNELSRREK